jgi:hypothetical protein
MISSPHNTLTEVHVSDTYATCVIEVLTVRQKGHRPLFFLSYDPQTLESGLNINIVSFVVEFRSHQNAVSNKHPSQQNKYTLISLANNNTYLGQKIN